MRAKEAKIQRARELAQRRLAPEKNIRKRAFNLARAIMRKKLSGRTQAEYEKLGPSEKIAIDKLLDKKVKAIKKLALRLLPKVHRMEHERLQSYLAGHGLDNLGAKEGNSMSEDINELFTEAFGASLPLSPYGPSSRESTSTMSSGLNGGKITSSKGGSKSPNIVMHKKFKAESALARKAEEFGIDLDILKEVFVRGLDSWNENHKLTQEQYAFARVNSYINQGKTYFNEDADLHEARAPGRAYVEPYHHPETGKQIGWKSSTKWGKTKYWQMFAKDKAMKHAGLSEQMETGETEKTHRNSKIRKKIEKVDRALPHTELGKQGEIITKILEAKLGNKVNDPAKRLQGTDSLTKAYKGDTPGEDKNLNESFNIAFAAGVGVTLTARDLGMQAQSGFAHHPSVIREMEEVDESAFTSDREPVIIPAHRDAYGNQIPAKSVFRRTRKKIVGSGNPHDGE